MRDSRAGEVGVAEAVEMEAWWMGGSCLECSEGVEEAEEVRGCGWSCGTPSLRSRLDLTFFTFVLVVYLMPVV